MSLRASFESLSISELVSELSIKIYQEPLSNAREHLHEVADEFRIALLILDFDTEVNMQGMLGFLENSTGLYFPETIDAFKSIGASATVEILQSIEKTLLKHGVSPKRLRDDFDGKQPFEITTFKELHGDLGSMPKEVHADELRLYIYGAPGTHEPVWSLLEVFVEKHRSAIFAEVGRLEQG